MYIASRLPSRSETFVYREVIALRNFGLEVVTASVREPETGLGDEELELMARSSFVVYKGVFAVIRDLYAELFRDASRTCRTVVTALHDSLDCHGYSPSRLSKTLVHAVSGISLARRIRCSAVRRIHAHMAHVPTSIAMYASMHGGIAFSFTGHGADLFRDASVLKSKLVRASHVVCISLWHRAVYYRLHRRPVHEYPLVRCGVDPGNWGGAEDESDHAAAGLEFVPMILSVARLVPKKGIDVLVRALGRMLHRGVAFRAVVAGDGPELESLKSLAGECGIARHMEWAGAIDHSKVAALIRRSAVFALPCVIASDGDRDGIPVVLMAAMASGVPCVSTDFPAIRELIEDGVSGRLVPAEDHGALEQAICELISDPAARVAMGAAGKEQVESEFSTTVNTRRLLRVFDSQAEVAL